jgi:membrane protein YdbS with pleckstrin-like domain
MTDPPADPPGPDEEPSWHEPGHHPYDDDNTEPIPRVPDEGPGFAAGSSYSDGARYAGDAGYQPDVGYAGESGREYRAPQFSKEELAGLSYDASGVPLGPRRILPLEDEPSGLVARYLFPTERYRGEWRRHWIHLTTPLLIGIVATLAFGYLAGFLSKHDVANLTGLVVVIWIIVILAVGWRIGDWHFDRFILTNKRVMVVNGIITRRVAMMPLLRVTDMKYEQSPLGRALNYGTFVLESAGQEQALREIKHLPNPNELYLRVVEEMYEPQAVEARLGKSPTAEDGSDDGS